MQKFFKSKSSLRTKKFAAGFAKSIGSAAVSKRRAVVLALEGNLGAGKTTFVQGFARGLGIEENVLSPTFVLMKIYKIRQRSKVKGRVFRHFVHIDCYRLDSPKDLFHLGFKNLVGDKDAIILIEWADRVRGLLPKSTVWISFLHQSHPQERLLKIKY